MTDTPAGLDEKALEAAYAAVHPTSPPHIAIPAAISAYLSALPQEPALPAEGVTVKALLDAIYSEPDYVGGGHPQRDDEGLLCPGSPYDRGRYDARKLARQHLSALVPAQPAGGEVVQRDVERLRRALIETGRHLGAGLADSVSTDFLMLIPEEARLVMERYRRPSPSGDAVREAGAIGGSTTAYSREQLAKLAFVVFYSPVLCAPQNISAVVKEIDCCPGCEHLSGGGMCPVSERGDYCPNDLAETLRQISFALYGPRDPSHYVASVFGPDNVTALSPGLIEPTAACPACDGTGQDLEIINPITLGPTDCLVCKGRGTAAPANLPKMEDGTVYVDVSGLTGTGKSAVMGEIEIALRAIGLEVSHDRDFQSEKNMTHADWQDALDLYKPRIVLRETNIPRSLLGRIALDGGRSDV